MNQTLLPTYAELSRVLDKTQHKLHPSQAHGIICGTLCGDPTVKPAWESLITGGPETTQTHTILQQLYDSSANQLEDFLFDFQLVLPDEEESLPMRAEALTLWCQGFLTGLQMVQVKITDRESGEATDAINDLIEIAKMNYEDVVASEEDEAAYIELVEYVRMAIILIYQDLRDVQTAKNSSEYLH